MASDKYALDPQMRVLLADLGVNHENVLRRAGLPGDLLNRPNVALAGEEYHRFWTALDAEAGHPALPLLLMNAITVEAFNPVLFATLCSADLRQAARRLQTYKSLIGPMRLDIDTDADTTTIACRWLDDQPPSSLAVAELLFWVAMARIGTRVDVRPISIVTVRPPVDQAPYVDALHVAIEHGPQHAITFAAVDAARPFLTVNEAMWEQ
ncbi:MAG: AraC family transcriptional regulator ligand-binding domain-containing protein, partial [Actinomycetota bacterium]